MQYEIALMPDDCNCRAFSCGHKEIDAWFRSKSLRRHKDYLVRTFTAHLVGNLSPIGFYSMTLGSEEWGNLQKADRRSSDGRFFPAVTIHYLAVHKPMQRNGVGRDLMAHALEQACAVAMIAGSHAVRLAADNARLVPFYEKLGFRTYSSNGERPLMMLPIRSLLES